MKSLLLLCVFATSLSKAVTIEELRNTPGLTPGRFASFFSRFAFRYHSEVQPPEVFLATESGDCDDYAILAAAILKEKGYTTRLITVRMLKVTHVVCYVAETRSYLDYNNRGFISSTVHSGPEISEIASHVAKSYRAKWSSASEFIYEEGAKRLVKTIVEESKDGGKLAAALD
ncbi:MAG TPA: transglutaminase domain-containing protein [Verrucomicrobiae bacterium]|jgi:hypothetical protein|nr:transglutaminase domain-containing protein [Verrucomicrobiae bacterium]